ncbi:MAG TPA: PhzF family phenazine biosynthesis protein [Bacillales bacterium]|nr:PhzF family phenazine biosynthesis protein [Bacillales bacterium]
MSIPIYQVDAFTDQAFSGNPAAVCLLDGQKDDQWMQNVAAEMNLSETAFLLKEEDGYRLRWFTPTSEVALCGHATLASAHVLWETGEIPQDQQAKFLTKSGILTADFTEDGIRLNFPAKPQIEAVLPDGAAEALGAEPVYVGRNEFDYLVEVESEEAVRNLEPDFAFLRKVQARGFIVTSRGDSAEFDCVSRFFATGVGVDEDPVTGSAHCCLGPYWQEKLQKDELTAYQASERGGTIQIGINDGRVDLTGKAVTILKGALLKMRGRPK